MGRVSIIGNAAGGKSTLCKKLKVAKSLPLFAVDKLQWKPGWIPVPREDVASGIKKIIIRDKWIIDGWGPWETIEERFEKSDTIILIDHKVLIHFWWAAKRQVKALLFPDSIEKPEGCDLAPMTLEMFKMIWMIHKTMRPRLLQLVEEFRNKVDIFHIRSPRELKRFMARYC